MLDEIDIPALEAAIEKQALDSGFAQGGRGVSDRTGAEDRRVQEPAEPEQLCWPPPARNPSSVISNLQVHATDQHDAGALPRLLKGLDCGVTVSFDVAIGEDLNLHLSGTFEEELRVTLNTRGGAVWKTKKVWIIRIPYIADYRMTGNVDLYNYTGIDIKATLTTSGRRQQSHRYRRPRSQT